MDLNGKTVAITGGASGLGKALAIAFVHKGARVAIGDKNPENLNQTAKELGVMGIQLDTQHHSSVERFGKYCIQGHNGYKGLKHIDYWVNNAGVWMPNLPIEEEKPDRVSKLIAVNVLGTYFGIQIALKHMRAVKSGTILNIGSITVFKGRNGSSSAAYVASKCAIQGLTRIAREQCLFSPIKVLAVYPKGIQTALFEQKKPDKYSSFMAPELVASGIIQNLEKDEPEEEQTFW